jgi:hypothetical protein
MKLVIMICRSSDEPLRPGAHRIVFGFRKRKIFIP